MYVHGEALEVGRRLLVEALAVGRLEAQRWRKVADDLDSDLDVIELSVADGAQPRPGPVTLPRQE